MTAPYSNNQK